MYLRLSYILVWLLCFTSFSVLAQNDTIAMVSKDTVVSVPPKGFNARNYSMMRRYRPTNDPFKSETFTDNTFVSARLGVFGIIGNDELRDALGANLTFGYGKWFNEYNAVRLDMGIGYYNRHMVNHPGQFAEISALHMFNFSSYLGGYRIDRFCEISSVEGISGVISKGEDRISFGAGFHLGLNVNLKLTKRLHLFLEPLASIYTNGIDPNVSSNWHKYHFSYRTVMGVNYYLGSDIQKDRISRDNLYLFVAGGVQGQNSEFVKEEIGLWNSIGPNAQLGVGYWINDYLCMRGSVFGSEDKWIQYEINGSQDKLSAYYGGIRAEIEFDPFYFIINKPIRARHFLLSFLAGPELGYMLKKDYVITQTRVETIQYRSMYLGVTFAVQPKFYFTDNLGVYLESRYSYVPYSIVDNSSSGVPVRDNYYDGIFNFNLGFFVHL